MKSLELIIAYIAVMEVVMIAIEIILYLNNLIKIDSN
jgi:hypothetical protein